MENLTLSVRDSTGHYPVLMRAMGFYQERLKDLLDMEHMDRALCTALEYELDVVGRLSVLTKRNYEQFNSRTFELSSESRQIIVSALRARFEHLMSLCKLSPNIAKEAQKDIPSLTTMLVQLGEPSTH